MSCSVCLAMKADCSWMRQIGSHISRGRGMSKHIKGVGSPGVRVTMSELDASLSEWVARAHNGEPVAVVRYESPWICMVNYYTWTEINSLKYYLPKRAHPLVNMREMIDAAFWSDAGLTCVLSERCVSGMDARAVIRAWVLQIIYSRPSEIDVYEGVRHNMLWRWFVGYESIIEPLPDEKRFIEDLQMVSAESAVIELVCNCILDVDLPKSEFQEFEVNFGLLNSLRKAQKSSCLGLENTNSGRDDIC